MNFIYVQNTNRRALLSSFFWARGRAAGLSRGIFLGAEKRTVSNQTNHRAQKGYPAHIPRAARRPQILSPVQPKHAHIKRRQVRRSHQHSTDPAPARRKSGAPPTHKLTSQNTSLPFRPADSISDNPLQIFVLSHL